ncbi:hypothetical protein M3Y96_00837100 [Aphelenchoides besseyi]|nr:hypothetical protein M3Y96_00837100 [Aphelenchoides besseyi]
MDENSKLELEQKPSEILTRYVRSLSHQDLVKILTPIKARLLSEETVFCLNTMNFSVEHIELSFTAREFLEFLGPSWQKWIHSAGSEVETYQSATIDVVEHVRYGGFESIEMPPTDFVSNFIDQLTKHQKRAVLMCARDGLLTDESFLNVSSYEGPDRIQVSMKKVVDIIREWELHKMSIAIERPWIVRILCWSHFSSADFERSKKADLDVRQLYSSRQKMSVYFTILFAFMTFMTFFSHVWSNITNYKDIEEKSTGLSIAIVVLASLLIGALIIIHQYKYRIYAIRIIQFVLLWYTMLLAVYAHEFDLNIYPALTCKSSVKVLLYMDDLFDTRQKEIQRRIIDRYKNSIDKLKFVAFLLDTRRKIVLVQNTTILSESSNRPFLCVLTNGFGLMLFMRITHFFNSCRKDTNNPTILYAR